MASFEFVSGEKFKMLDRTCVEANHVKLGSFVAGLRKLNVALQRRRRKI